MGRAMVLEKPGPIREAPLRAQSRDDARPGAGEIAIEISACAVCRTDLQLCEGDLAARTLPIVPGHQIVGRVVAVGDGVSAFRLGDRACIGWLAGSCGECPHCKHGRENLCEQARFTGWDRDGGYATRAIVRADFALRTPDSFTDTDAAPLLCGGVIGYRSLVRSRIEPGGKLGLYGFGASATLTIQVARHWGCRVFVCTRSENEQARAKALGAEWAGGYDELPPVPLDAAITFAPAGDVVIAALRALDRGGTVAINAIHLDRVPQFSYDLLWWERNLVSVANYTRDDARKFLELAATIPIRATYETHPLEQANVALQRLRDGHVSGAAVLTMK
jgi:alcohol dehydrogenase, propanol-preferring